MGRADGSGTRNAFENRVLGGNTEPSPTSDANDCATRDRTYKNTDITRCEQNSTDRLLKTVAQTPGAIGYAELNYAQAYAKRGQLRLLGLDGESPSLKAVRERAYPFWAPEYAYTYGVPPNNSLMSRFLDYMAGDTGRNVMESHGHLPCSVPENQSACQQARGDEW